MQAKIELEGSQKPEVDKRVIRAEALDKIQDLAQAEQNAVAGEEYAASKPHVKRQT